MYRLLFFCCITAVTLMNCQIKRKQIDTLSLTKDSFIEKICNNSDFEEGPFYLNYQLRPIFLSKNVVSFFGKINLHDRLPHGLHQLETLTLYKNQENWNEITLNNLFYTEAQKKFLIHRCESALKLNPLSYFFGEKPLYTTLSWDQLNLFVIDDTGLIVIFQPYAVGSYEGEPIQVKIPFSQLKHHLDTQHPFYRSYNEAIESGVFQCSWEKFGS